MNVTAFSYAVTHIMFRAHPVCLYAACEKLLQYRTTKMIKKDPLLLLILFTICSVSCKHILILLHMHFLTPVTLACGTVRVTSVHWRCESAHCAR